MRLSEHNYPAHKLEFLALKWAFTDKFHDYHYGTIFEVITDINPLIYVLAKAKLDATAHTWLADLAGYELHDDTKQQEKNKALWFSDLEKRCSGKSREMWGMH